ncbi:MAG: YdcH family protein [Luteimonas sp.]|nr:YdcH family protein [Luteimonas sp.]
MQPFDASELARVTQRLVELRVEHRDLDAAIARLQADIEADELTVKRLKKRKLQLKDSISRLESALIPTSRPDSQPLHIPLPRRDASQMRMSGKTATAASCGHMWPACDALYVEWPMAIALTGAERIGRWSGKVNQAPT